MTVDFTSVVHKIPNEVLDAWAEALESETYTQGSGHLRQQDGDGPCEDCCLGVLCIVLKEKFDWQIEWYHTSDGTAMQFFYTEDHEVTQGVGLLPDGVRKRLGMTERTQQSFVDLNDGFVEGGGGKVHTFPEIAVFVKQMKRSDPQPPATLDAKEVT